MRGAATKSIRALRRRAPSGCGPQALWLCYSLLTYRSGYSSSLAPRQRAWGPAAKCEVILREPLATESQSRRGSSLCVSAAEHLWMAKNCGRIFFYENERTAVANDCGRE